MAIFQETTATKKIVLLTKRIRAIQGSSSASKTISILLYLIASSQSDKTPTVTSIVSESFPHLRRGVMRDFLNIMEGHHYFKRDLWDKTNSVYTFETGSKIEFFSVDQEDKVRGARRDRLFINEANNISLETFNQLEIRTNQFVFLDWNPSNEFWFYTDVLGKRDDIDHLTLTYLDNEALNPEIIKSLEKRKSNLAWWKVYGLGQLGEIEGKVYKDWQIIDKLPHEARLISYGLDFGYTNDPTAICAIYYYNGGYIIDEVAYSTGLLNKNIYDLLSVLPKATIIADSAEPKSIDELRGYGLTVLPATKGKGSVSQGIAFVQQQRMSLTKSSINFIKSYRNYVNLVIDGKTTNEPDHFWSDGMDAVRYGMQIRQNLNEPEPYIQKPYEHPGLQPQAEYEPIPLPMPFKPFRR